jgi:hypothetical protein
LLLSLRHRIFNFVESCVCLNLSNQKGLVQLR